MLDSVSHATSSLSRKNTRIVRMRNISLGQTSIRIGGLEIKIFNHERTIGDAFRYLDKETALKALQAYLKGNLTRKPNIDNCNTLKNLESIYSPYISALTL